MKKNDYELLYMFAQGDESALTELIEKYKRSAFYFIHKYKHALQGSYDISELYHISIIALYKAIITYKESANTSFSTYYSVLLEREYLMCIRSLYREQNKSNVEAMSLDALVQETEGVYLVDTIQNKRIEFEPEGSFRYAHLLEEVQRVLTTCDSLEKEIFQLWREGFSYQEISDLLGQSVKKVDNIMQKLKKKLKGQLTI